MALRPRQPGRDERVSHLGRLLIVMCDEGYQSSLAAANPRRLGFAPPPVERRARR